MTEPARLSELRLAKAYVTAKTRVLSAGYGEEVVWQQRLKVESLTESEFLRECAWVILSAGMRETIVHRKFPQVSLSFFLWESARRITESAAECCRSARCHFNHRRKIEAIAEVARLISAEGFDATRRQIMRDPIATLRRFPYIGPITVCHLAKNIGVPTAKPDRHLTRLALAAGYHDVQAFCRSISEFIGDAVGVVDIVLWRFATLSRTYVTDFLSYAQAGANPVSPQ